MLLVDEYVALPSLAGRAPVAVQGQAIAITHDWAIRFADAASAPDAVRQAADELGLDLQVLA